MLVRCELNINTVSENFREEVKSAPDQSIFFFAKSSNGKKVLLKPGTFFNKIGDVLGTLQQYYASEDGFLYLFYTDIATFGSA